MFLVEHEGVTIYMYLMAFEVAVVLLGHTWDKRFSPT